MIQPTYSERFRCAGSACEDTCCNSWRVTVDRATYEEYQRLPASPLHTLIDESIHRLPDCADGNIRNGTRKRDPAQFAIIQALPSHLCPFLTEGRLCRIHAELGEQYLGNDCATYPRIRHIIDKMPETVLDLSCIEAARQILLDPHPMQSADESSRPFPWNEVARSGTTLRSYFWPIRAFSIDLIRNRAYPLWQRMFLLGTFCRRLDAMARGEAERDFPAFFRDFSAAVTAGSLRTSMETIPANLGLQLDLVLSVVNLRLGDNSHASPRLLESLQNALRGINHLPNVPIENQIAAYALAWERYAAPFFAEHPYFLENYLINTIFMYTFPFSDHLYDSSYPLDIAGAFARLAIQFTLVKGLLIGSTGHHKEAFSPAYAVQTVQTAFKFFEHDSQFLDRAHGLLVSLDLDNARGHAILLHN
jgi:lysine-N-methylase